MSDAKHRQVGRINFDPDLFSTFADGCLFNRLAALEVSPDRAIAPVLEPGVGSSLQEDGAGT